MVCALNDDLQQNGKKKKDYGGGNVRGAAGEQGVVQRERKNTVGGAQ